MENVVFAVAPFETYRYAGRYGWIYVGAMDEREAMTEVQRSLCGDTAARYRLQKWDGQRFVEV